jgi:hypothetical protein
MKSKLFIRSLFSLFLIVCISLMNVSSVLADGTTPPPATAEPTEEPAQPTEEPVVPVATEASTEEETPTSSDQTPAEDETPISPLLAQLPEETSVVVLDETGNPIPLASQDAAEIIVEADPIWCPATVATPTPNLNGCTQDFATPALLLNFLQANQNNALYRQAGVIYLEAANPVNVPVFIDAALFPTFKNYSLKVKGGWNNVNSAPAGTITTFDNNDNAYLHIGSSTSPWIGNVTIQDIFVQDNGVNNTPSIQVYTTNGSVTLDNVDTDDIDDSTAINVVVTGTGSVNLTGVDVSNGTDGSGITVTTNSGNITLSDVDVTNQSDGYTANLQSQSGNISITNGSSNGSSFDGGNNSNGFVATTSTGSITITGAAGNGNQVTFTDAVGSANGATLSAPTVSLTRVTADNNALNGIQITDANAVTLNNVIATDNGTVVTGPDVGSGVRVIGTGTTVVNITGGTFSNNQRYPIEISNGTYSITNPTPSRTGNGESNNIVVDSTAPTMSPTTSCSLPGNNGWCRGTITINWNVNDAQSAVNTTGCPTSYNTNTSASGTSLTCSATSTGGTTNNSVTVYRDATAPNTTGTKSPAANGNGWNNSDVTVSFTATDSGSGIASCSSPATISTEGANQPVTGRCYDVAGNYDDVTVYVSIDKSAPTMSPSTTCGLPGNGAWCRGNININWGINDPQSSYTTTGCQTSFNTNTSAAGTTLSCTATSGGGSTNRTITVYRDATAPTISGTKTPASNAAGWNTTDVTVSFGSSDPTPGSGFASCTPATPVTVTNEGTSTVAGTCYDVAGNSSTTNVIVRIDKTAPTVTADLSETPNANGWIRNTFFVWVNIDGSDTGSGISSCSGDTLVWNEGATQVQGSCTDRAGNSSIKTFPVNIDRTNPAATATKNPLPNSNGWNNTDVVVTFTGTDTPSGIDYCTAPATVSTEGTNQTRSGTCTDKAGNVSNTATANNINIDKTAPTITLVSRTPANTNGWNSGNVTVTWSCTDSRSGVVSSTISQTVTSEGANQSVTGTCQDRAGNTASNTQNGINIDKSAPTLNLPATVTVEATSASGATATYSASASDMADPSVPVNCSPASGTPFPMDNTTVNCSGTDDAGNTTTGSFTVTVQDTTGPSLTLPANATIEATSAAGAAVTYSASASDIVNGPVTVNCSPASGSAFAFGTTTVNCSAKDAKNNTSSGSFTVTVQDTTAPMIAPQTDVKTSIQNIFGNKKISYTLTTTDAVDGAGTAICSPVSDSLFKVGKTLVTCTATDSHGNAAIPVTFTIEVTHESAVQSSTTIIPVTGGETIDLDCNTTVMLNGIQVLFYNLCDQQTVLTAATANTLPGSIPAGLTFVAGLNINVQTQDNLLDLLPANAGIEMDFPTGNGQFAVMYWNNGRWVEITQSLDESGLSNALNADKDNELYKLISSEEGMFKVLTTENTGTFVLVKK